MKESNLSELLNRRLALLGKREHLSLLEQCLHGIEGLHRYSLPSLL